MLDRSRCGKAECRESCKSTLPPRTHDGIVFGNIVFADVICQDEFVLDQCGHSIQWLVSLQEKGEKDSDTETGTPRERGRVKEEAENRLMHV